MTEQEYEVVRVMCLKCRHYQIMSPDEADKITQESYQCKLCYVKPGLTKMVQRFDQCAQCGQVMGKERLCFCPEKPPLVVHYPQWSKPKSTKIKDEIQDGKTFELLKTKMELSRLEPQRLQKENNKLLKQLIELQTPKKEAPVKKYSGQAIQ